MDEVCLKVEQQFFLIESGKNIVKKDEVSMRYVKLLRKTEKQTKQKQTNKKKTEDEGETIGLRAIEK